MFFLLLIVKIASGKVVLGGMVYYPTTNTNTYLCTGQNYWTMSPSHYDKNSGAIMLIVNKTGSLSINRVDFLRENHGIRPTVNLKANTILEMVATSSFKNLCFLIKPDIILFSH